MPIVIKQRLLRIRLGGKPLFGRAFRNAVKSQVNGGRMSKQDLEAETELGVSFLAEPGLIILPEVTYERMENAVRHLWSQGYFESLKSLKAEKETIFL